MLPQEADSPRRSRRVWDGGDWMILSDDVNMMDEYYDDKWSDFSM